MKGFFALFKESAKELKSIRTLTTAGVLMALAIVLRATSVQITPEVRISFAYLAIAIIGMLFGPVVAGMAGFGTDFIGFLFNNTGYPYYFPLSLVAIMSGVIYGIFMYKKYSSKKKFLVFACLSRILVVLLCNICLNSYLFYTGFVNKDFHFFSSEGWDSFITWLLASQRITKNVIQLPFDLILVCTLLPMAYYLYNKVRKSFASR